MKIAFVLVSVISLVAANYSLADPITVSNFGFEDPAVADYDQAGYTPSYIKFPWNATESAWYVTSEGTLWGGIAQGNKSSRPAAPEGLQFGWFAQNNSGSYSKTGIAQDLGNASASMQYEAIIEALQEDWVTYTPGQVVKLQLLLDGSVVASQTLSLTNSFAAYSVKYTSIPADAGKVLTIKLYADNTGATGDNSIAFDNIRVYANDIGSHAWNPVPGNGATDVNLVTILTWNAATSGGPYTHKVYLGNDPSSLTLVYSGIAAEFSPATMKYSTKYYWRVDEFDGVNTLPGYIWSFTTVSPKCSSGLPGDMDGDCYVGFEDLSLMALNWLQCTRLNGPCE